MTAAVNREALATWYRQNRQQSRTLFDLVRPEACYSRPISLRHSVVFYEGHLPAFGLNTVLKKALGRTGVNEHLEDFTCRSLVAARGSRP